MGNPLRAAYKNGGTPPPAASQPAVATASAPTAEKTTQATLPVQTTQIPPGAGGSRNLSSLRAKLAGGGNTGVNPPEAAAALTDDATKPRTVETPDGGAQPAPGWVEGRGGNVVRAPDASALGVAGSTQPSGELTRGQKAALTRAKNKAAAQAAAGGAQPSTAVPAAAAEPSAGVPLSDRVYLRGYATEALIAEILRRVTEA
jgi:hypothetical protein